MSPPANKKPSISTKATGHKSQINHRKKLQAKRVWITLAPIHFSHLFDSRVTLTSTSTLHGILLIPWPTGGHKRTERNVKCIHVIEKNAAEIVERWQNDTDGWWQENNRYSARVKWSDSADENYYFITSLYFPSKTGLPNNGENGWCNGLVNHCYYAW